MRIPVKISDIIIILTAAGITFFSFYNVYMKPQWQVRFLIRGQGREWVFPIDSEETVLIPGPLGETRVRLGNKSAHVEASPCKNQTCVAAGIIMRRGSWAACLPNNVLILIEDGMGAFSLRYESQDNDGDIDAVAW